MKTPPFFIGFLLLFWGLESDHLVLSAMAAILMEGSHFIKEKWTLSDDDFIRISDLTSVILLATIALIVLNKQPLSFFRETAVWQPLILLPLMLAQLYSTNDKIVIGTRIGSKRQKSYRHPPMDFSLYYVTLSLLAVAAANSRSALFFPGISILLAWLLFYNRGKSFSLWFFIGCLAISAVGGYFGYLGFERVQEEFRRASWHMMRAYYYNRYRDPYKASIATGSIGELKLSGEILIRIPAMEQPPPALLWEASYNTFSGSQWMNTHQPFGPASLADESIWDLTPPPHPEGQQIILEQNIERERGLIARPRNSFRLVSPSLFELERNPAGTLRALDCAPVVTGTYSYNQTPLETDLPAQRNTIVPKSESHVLNTVSSAIWDENDTAEEKLEKLETFFLTNFTYSLQLIDEDRFQSVLENFLLSSRKGHCELFATATTLLLRTAGIPTRYITGYAVEEFSELEDRYVVRARHAHAWCEAYVNGKWIVVDNTPPDWLAQERSLRSFIEPVKDLYAYLRQLYKRFKVNSEQKYNTLFSVIVVILSCLLIFSIYRRLQIKKVEEATTLKRIFTPQDSPFFLLEKYLEEQGLPRQENEPFHLWLNRIDTIRPIPREEILQLHLLHQKLRFDNANFSIDDGKTLVDGVNTITSRI